LRNTFAQLCQSPSPPHPALPPPALPPHAPPPRRHSVPLFEFIKNISSDFLLTF
jgi:hypothetical protein